MDATPAGADFNGPPSPPPIPAHPTEPFAPPPEPERLPPPPMLGEQLPLLESDGQGINN